MVMSMDEVVKRRDAKITFLPDTSDEEYTVTLEGVDEGSVNQVKGGDTYRLELNDADLPDGTSFPSPQDVLDWEVVITIEDDVTYGGRVTDYDEGALTDQIIITKEEEIDHEDSNNLLYG